MDSFDKDSFTQDALSYSENCMLLYFDFYEMRVEHKPDHIKRFPSLIKLPLPKNKFILKAFFPIWWLLLFSTFMFVFGYLCLRYKPKVCWTEITWVGMVFGLAKKFGLCENFIYCTGDWLAHQKNSSFLSRLSNDYIFVYTDYIAATHCDLLISYSIKCGQARESYWGKKLSSNHYNRYPPPIQICKTAVDKKATEICFLGQVRDDSGLDKFIPLLESLNKMYGIRLKIIGPPSAYRDRIEKIIYELNCEHLVDLYGWLPQNELLNVMQNCFCGINLLVNSTYALYAIPGKIIQYLQMQIPVLITDNSGVSETVQKNKLGIIIDLNFNALEDSIEKLFKYQSEYRMNIKKYAKQYPNKRICEYLAMIEN